MEPLYYTNTGPRTNNSAEGFHSKLIRAVNRNSPNFYQILQKLLEIQFEMEIYLERIEAGMDAKKRKKKYIIADQMINRLKEQFRTTEGYSLESYMLNNISNAIKFIIE